MSRPRRIRLTSGDIAVWGGPARLAFHGIASLANGEDSLTGHCRINLTFRKALRLGLWAGDIFTVTACVKKVLLSLALLSISAPGAAALTWGLPHSASPV